MKTKTIKINGKLYYSFVMALAMIISLSAVSGLSGNYEQSYDLKRSCINNGTYCSSSALCNVTIAYPDGKLLLSNQRMTYQVSYYNYTINGTSLDQIGEYPITMMCQDGSLFGSEIFLLNIRGGGNSVSGIFSLDFSNTATIVFSVIAIILTILLMVFAYWELGCIFLFIEGVILLANYAQIGIAFGIILMLSGIALAFMKK